MSWTLLGFNGITSSLEAGGGPIVRTPGGQVDRRRPSPPGGLTVTVTGDFAITVSFKDTSVNITHQAHPLPISIWQIRVCQVASAGSPDATRFPLWRDRVLANSRVIATAGSAGNGDTISISITDPSLLDCYVQVVGISEEDVLGFPTDPYLVFASGLFPAGNLDPVIAQSVNLVDFTDDDGVQYVDLNPQYTGPFILGRFYGVALYCTGYVGNGTPTELGNLLLYESTIGGKVQKNKLRLPVDPLASACTLYWVSVDRQGKRRDDILSAPSTFLAGGIV